MSAGFRIPPWSRVLGAIVVATVLAPCAAPAQDAGRSTPYGALDRTDFDSPPPDGASNPALLGAAPRAAEATRSLPATAPVARVAPAVPAVPDPVMDQAAMDAAARAPVLAGASDPPASWVPNDVRAKSAAPQVDPAVARLKERARAALSTGAVAAARALLSDPALARDGEALHMLADTYDDAALARNGVVGVSGDADAARRYGAAAVAAGWRPGPVAGAP